AASENSVDTFVKTGTLPTEDQMDMPRAPRNGAAHLAAMIPLGSVTAPVTSHVLLAYTEDFSIEYLNRRLRPYWQRNGETVEEMLSQAERDYASLEQRGTSFDEELTADLEKAGGPAYAQIAILTIGRRWRRTDWQRISMVLRCSSPRRTFPTAAFPRWMSSILQVRFSSSSIPLCW